MPVSHVCLCPLLFDGSERQRGRRQRGGCLHRERGKRSLEDWRERGNVRREKEPQERHSLFSLLTPPFSLVSVSLSDSKARFLHRVSLLLRGVFGIVSLQTIQRVSL